MTERRSIRLGLPAWVGLSVALGLVSWFAWSSWRVATLRERALIATRNGRWDEAEATLAPLQWYRPADTEVLKMRVNAALNRDDPETAIRVLAAVPPDTPDAERAHMTRGRLLMEMFRLREAEAEFRRCVRNNPQLIEAHIQVIILSGLKRRSDDFERDLWAFYHDCGQPISALRMLSRGIAMLPDRTTVDRTLDEGDLLGRCLRADPADPEVRPPLARYYVGRGEPEKALALLDPWLHSHPDDVPARVEWLACRLDASELEPLRPWFEAPFPAARGTGRYWMLRGDWLARQGRYAEAAESLREAVRLDDRDPEPHFRLGMALRALGRDDESRRHLDWVNAANQLKSLIHKIPDVDADPALLLRAGRLCAEMGRDREARAWFGQVLRRDPGHAEVREALRAMDRRVTDSSAPSEAAP